MTILCQKIIDQKKHFKDGSGSICAKCINYDHDCFNADKLCEPCKKTGFSKVVKCGSLNKALDESYSRGQSISVSHEVDSRIDSMGGGFHKIDKYN